MKPEYRSPSFVALYLIGGALGIYFLVGIWKQYDSTRTNSVPTGPNYKMEKAKRILSGQDRSNFTRVEIRSAMETLNVPDEERRAQERVWELIDGQNKK